MPLRNERIGINPIIRVVMKTVQVHRHDATLQQTQPTTIKGNGVKLHKMGHIPRGWCSLGDGSLLWLYEQRPVARYR